jgi:hypothetical protein
MADRLLYAVIRMASGTAPDVVRLTVGVLRNQRH